MRFLWTLFKLALALCVAIPVAIIALAVGFGILGVFVALAVLALKLAIFALVAVGLYRLASMLFGSEKPAPRDMTLPPAAARDPYHDAAMRELDEALGERR